MSNPPAALQTAEALLPRPSTPRQWRHGVWGCLSNRATCVTGCFCPCVLFGQTQHRLDHDNSVDTYESCNSTVRRPAAAPCAPALTVRSA